MATSVPAQGSRVRAPSGAAANRGAGQPTEFREVVWLSPDGEIEALSADEARDRLKSETVMVCHARATARRLDIAGFAALDVLELFAFVRPARFCVPTPRGVAMALSLRTPDGMAASCVALVTAARALLQELGQETDPNARAIAETAERAGWGWGPAVLAALPPSDQRRAVGLRAWQALEEWQEARAAAARARQRSGRRADEARDRPRRSCSARRAEAAAAARPIMPPPSPTPSCRASTRTSRKPAVLRRGRHRCRQDPGLHRAGKPVGREGRTRAR